MSKQQAQATILSPDRKLIDYVHNYIANMKSGDDKSFVISYQEIENIINIQYRLPCNHTNRRFNQYITKASHILLDNDSIITKSIRGYGMRFILPNSYNEDKIIIMENIYKSGVNMFAKAKKISNLIDISNVDTLFKNSYDEMIDGINKVIT